MSEIYWLVRGGRYAEAKRYTEPTDRCFWTVFIDHDWKFETVLTLNYFNGDPCPPPGDRWEIDEPSPETGETIWKRRCTVSRKTTRFQKAEPKARVRKKKTPSAVTPGAEENTVVNGDYNEPKC